MRVLFFILALFPLSQAISSWDYGPTFEGDGTYFGYTTAGNCAIRAPLPGMYEGMVPVAINNEQYGNSDACGACLIVTGTGEGSGANPITGTFKAYVMDRCPECKKGDIDLSKSGDGRWRVKWKFVPCPGEKPFFLFEGSNEFYWKLQPRGTKYPIQKIIVGGISGERTQDNFYICQNGGGFKTPASVVMTDTMGTTMTSTLNYFKSDGPVYSTSSSGVLSVSGSELKPPVEAKTSTGTAGDRCVPKFKACTGPKNWWKTSRCCQPYFHCVHASSPNFVGKRCEPKVRGEAKCVPRWKACTGPDNKWGTSRCCDNFVCRRPWRKSFRGKRCIPRR